MREHGAYEFVTQAECRETVIDSRGDMRFTRDGYRWGSSDRLLARQRIVYGCCDRDPVVIRLIALWWADRVWFWSAGMTRRGGRGAIIEPIHRLFGRRVEERWRAAMAALGTTGGLCQWRTGVPGRIATV